MFGLIVLIYFSILNGMYFVMISMATIEIFWRLVLRRGEAKGEIIPKDYAPPIAVIVPAYNEEKTITETVHSLLKQEYGSLEIIVVNDGSKDHTIEVLVRDFALFPTNHIVRNQIQTQPVRAVFRSAVDPRIVVIDKENGGKADALNAGINAARAPLLCNIDADTIIERTALARMVEAIQSTDDNVIAVGGTIRVSNGCRIENGRITGVHIPDKWVARFQVVEYLRAFLFGRMGMNRLGGNLIISGAFGVFMRDAVVDAGGYLHDTVGEDMELVVRMHRRCRESNTPYRIAFLPDPICFTEVPESLKILGRQRDRWQRGLMDTMNRHRTMLFNPRYGAVGMFLMPFFAIFEMLGPIVESLGYIWVPFAWATGQLDNTFAALFFINAMLLGSLMTVLTLVMEEASFQFQRGVRARLILAAAALLENIGYRQATLFFRLRGIIAYLRGVKTWGKMERQGYAPVAK